MSDSLSHHSLRTYYTGAATSGDSGSSGVPPAGLAGGVAAVVALVLAILVLVAVVGQLPAAIAVSQFFTLHPIAPV